MKEKDKRINQIFETLLKYIQKDFSNIIPVSEKKDELDAISVGLNAMAEELHAYIIEKKKTEEEIRKMNAELEQRVIERTEEVVTAEKKFRALIENSSDGIAMLNRKGEVIYFSPSASKIDGFFGEDLIGQVGLGQVHPDDISHTKNLFEEGFKNPGKPIFSQHRILHKDGNWVWIEGTLTNFLHDPCINAYVINFRDITKRKQAEEQLRASEFEYHSLIEQATDGIFIYDKTGKYVNVNLSACKMLGYSKEELLKLSIDETLVHNDATNDTPNFDALLAGKTILSTSNLKRQDGSIMPVEINSKMLSNGKILGMVRDITERKKAEEKIQKFNEELELKVIDRTAQLEAVNKELEAFTYSVSHDLRSPLRSITGYSKIMEEDFNDKLDDAGKRTLGVIQQNVSKMNNLIDNLLEFSRLGKKEILKSEIDIEKLVHDTIPDIIHLTQNKVKIKLNTLFPAFADYHLLTQVWINLISNAIKYSSKKINPIVEIGSQRDAHEIIYYVKDNGAGFSMRYAKKLFGVFQRLHSAEEFEGTGVGLAIVQRIIARHGGRVWAEGEVDGGATFYFSLPTQLNP